MGGRLPGPAPEAIQPVSGRARTCVPTSSRSRCHCASPGPPVPRAALGDVPEHVPGPSIRALGPWSRRRGRTGAGPGPGLLGTQKQLTVFGSQDCPLLWESWKVGRHRDEPRAVRKQPCAHTTSRAAAPSSRPAPSTCPWAGAPPPSAASRACESGGCPRGWPLPKVTGRGSSVTHSGFFCGSHGAGEHALGPASLCRSFSKVRSLRRRHRHPGTCWR